MNTINLTGNVCNDIELKNTPSGKAVVSLNLAVKRPYSKDTTDFIPLVCWDKSAEYLSKYARKGSKIAVSGKLTTRKYQDKDGNNRTAFEVVCDSVELLDSKSEGTANNTMPKDANLETVDTDDPLPF